MYLQVASVIPLPLALYCTLAAVDVGDVLFRILLIVATVVIGGLAAQIRSFGTRLTELEKYQATDTEKGKGIEKEISSVHDAISNLHQEVRSWRVEMRGEVKEAADSLRSELHQHVQLKISEHKGACASERSRGHEK